MLFVFNFAIKCLKHDSSIAKNLQKMQRESVIK